MIHREGGSCLAALLALALLAGLTHFVHAGKLNHLNIKAYQNHSRSFSSSMTFTLCLQCFGVFPITYTLL